MALFGLIELIDSVELCYSNRDDSSVFTVSSYFTPFCSLVGVNTLFSLLTETPFYDFPVFFRINLLTGL